MKRSLIITFILLLLMSMSSLATNTRVLTMGDNNMILLDEANIWLFPSRINDYPKVVIGEFGTFSHGYFSGEYGPASEFTELGIHWKFRKESPCVLGTYLHNSDEEDVDVDVVHPIGSQFHGYYGFPYGYMAEFIPFDDDLMSNQRIDLFYGREWTIPVGVRLSLIHSSQKNNAPANVDEEGFRIYQLAVGWTWPVPRIDLSAGIELMSWTDKGTDFAPPGPASAYDESKPAGNWAVYAMGRRFVPHPPYTFVPHAGIYYAKNEAEYYDPPPIGLRQTDKYTRLGVEVGCGLQYAPSSNALAVIDFGLMYHKTDGEFKDSLTYKASLKTLTFPFFKAGADVKVFDWMDLRVGATNYWDRTIRENDFRWAGSEEELRMYRADNKTYLGFGFHWGDLHVDTYTDPNLFLRGLNFISGSNTDMNFQISALYEM